MELGTYIALETTFTNHIYQCQNVLYRQCKGGGIGARITGVVARIIMDLWMDLVTQTLEENEVVVYLMTKYVDDINVAISLIPRGYGWEKKGRKWKLKWFAKREEEDRERSAEQATLEKLRWLGDRMVPGLKLTQDLPEYHTSEKCPMLDFQVWALDIGSHSLIRNTFFEKATTSPLVFHAGSAYG